MQMWTPERTGHCNSLWCEHKPAIVAVQYRSCVVVFIFYILIDLNEWIHSSSRAMAICEGIVLLQSLFLPKSLCAFCHSCKLCNFPFENKQSTSYLSTYQGFNILLFQPSSLVGSLSISFFYIRICPQSAEGALVRSVRCYIIEVRLLSRCISVGREPEGKEIT